MNDRRSGSLRIPGYNENAALQLVAATGLCFIMYFASWVTMVVFGVEKVPAQTRVLNLVGLAPINEFLRKPWTLFTYGLAHNGFWVWISNAIWLYTFASVVQSLTGFRQVIPIFIYGLILGGLFALGVQLIPGVPPLSFRLTGAMGGVMAIMAAAVALAPRYRFYLGENLGIPLLIPAGIFLVLGLFRATDVARTDMLPLFGQIAGGLLAGFLAVTLLRSGTSPGDWMYNITGRVGRSFNPEARKLNQLREQRRRKQEIQARRLAEREISQGRVDEILDKINQRGYSSLTPDEREILLKASKETQQ